MQYSFKKNQNGQALLIVVLVMIIALTVGLSLISRSITNVKTSTDEANSQKALAAAEAGIEQTIKTNVPIAQSGFGSGDSEVTYSTSVKSVNGTNFLLNGGDIIQKDDNADLWMSDYSTNSAKLYLNPVSANIEISFGTSSDSCSNPAIEIDIISGSKAAPVINKYAYDPCASRRSSNHFSSPANGVGNIVEGISFKNKTPVISVTSGLFARITPIYDSGKIGVTSLNVSLPSQGSVISSVGSIGKTNKTTRSVSVFQGYPKIPAEFFPYTIFVP